MQFIGFVHKKCKYLAFQQSQGHTAIFAGIFDQTWLCAVEPAHYFFYNENRLLNKEVVCMYKWNNFKTQ